MRIYTWFALIIFLISCKKESSKSTINNNTSKILKETVEEKLFLLPLNKSLSDSTIKFPYKLKENEISIIIGISYGWFPYDERNHFVYSNDSTLKYFKEIIPKEYIKNNKVKYSFKEVELNSDLKSEFISNLNSSETKLFLNYEQENFKFRTNKVNRSCFITDSNGYSIHFIQNNNFKSYWHYAPKFALEKCEDSTINKTMLKEFIQLLENWNIEL